MEPRRVVGLVLARGGSRGVRSKNRKLIAGRPMISWVLKPMLDCRLIDEVWVSTDDEMTADIARSDGANIFMRGELCATDDATSVSAVDEFLRYKQSSAFDIVALVQCTSPCLHPNYLEEGIQLILNGLYDSVFSVNRDFKWRWTELSEDGTTRPLNFDPAIRMCRQQWSGELIESGHFYITRCHLVKEGLLQGGRCGFVEIPLHLCIEVDADEDFTVAELRLLKFGYKGSDSDLVLDAPREFQ